MHNPVRSECITPEIWVRWCRRAVTKDADRALTESDLARFDSNFDLSLLP